MVTNMSLQNPWSGDWLKRQLEASKLRELEADKIEPFKRNFLPKILLAEKGMLPYFPDSQWAVPVYLLRSSLFGVIKKGPRKFLEGVKLVTWGMVTIKFTGPQLNQYDLDVWCHCLSLLKPEFAGNCINFKLREFARAIGRDGSGKSLKEIQTSLMRLNVSLIELHIAYDNGKRTIYNGTLIMKSIIEDSKTWQIALNPDMIRVFINATSWLDRGARKSIKGDLAKWMYGFVSTHEALPHKPLKVSLEKIQALSGSQIASERKFKQSLSIGLKHLQSLSLVHSWVIEDSIISIVKKPKEI